LLARRCFTRRSRSRLLITCLLRLKPPRRGRTDQPTSPLPFCSVPGAMAQVRSRQRAKRLCQPRIAVSAQPSVFGTTDAAGASLVAQGSWLAAIE
jgi:hypothetical protein